MTWKNKNNNFLRQLKAQREAERRKTGQQESVEEQQQESAEEQAQVGANPYLLVGRRRRPPWK
jgi:hypothetical protein